MDGIGETERDQQTERARVADERDDRADKRDSQADDRDRRADERDERAELRETVADKREKRIKFHEARFESSPGIPPNFEVTLAEIDHESLDGAGAEVDRAKARLVASTARSEREQAEIDREVARSLRTELPPG
ncbi:hypothetical protein [Amycolatopsis sp. NPDC051371]|uniref:hypothetical protein n=1 Tax=Amycolatopsis sp. NPDC051371 TaxID=3155800 RepID=UPI003435D6E9